MRVKINRLLPRLLEVALGGLFFYVGMLKNYHPYEFAEAVLAYQLLPEALVGVTAAVLPWLELAGGLFLMVGLRRRSCLVLLMFLSAMFMAVLVITLARGLKIDCGCGLFFQRQVGPAAILEDGLFLLWAAGLYWWEIKREFGGGGQGS
ncbi:MAG: MauE/DoxX family redox-associated membrane protein [Desulfobaccales bacterium]|nr:MauE/DoxX family redox-associated membrane protein [Desulfobaccales bacterium]